MEKTIIILKTIMERFIIIFKIITPISDGLSYIYIIYSIFLYFILSNNITAFYANIYLNPIFKIYFLLCLYNFGSNNLLLSFINVIYFICIGYKISIDNLTKNINKKDYNITALN